MSRTLALLPLAILVACKPPASDDYVERARIDEPARGPSEPIDSPDTEDAIWAPAGEGARLLYGKPGDRPLFAIECLSDGSEPMLGYTRFARADAHSKAILALIGNGHVSRLKIDAAQVGNVWRWEGAVEVNDSRLDVLTGSREVEATVPGAGSLVLNSSALPGELVERCRDLAEPLTPDEPMPEPSPPADPA
ncbi:hypothetical protein [Qipengyuania qiaonensis]|uniref:Lipoprotein n=1 Tax=Qipengyuania qiaonensis TaxID=2867240 RepID=A0ABS7J532_9SPHN|nr:hypothetical protein [Qipengyuania qiaonensis]MBX7482450.1 hypothetical protein [Qipengyuania qiaonensis]